MVMEQMWYGWYSLESDVSLATIPQNTVRYTMRFKPGGGAHLPIEPKSTTIGALIRQYVQVLVINTDLDQ